MHDNNTSRKPQHNLGRMPPAPPLYTDNPSPKSQTFQQSLSTFTSPIEFPYGPSQHSHYPYPHPNASAYLITSATSGDRQQQQRRDSVDSDSSEYTAILYDEFGWDNSARNPYGYSRRHDSQRWSIWTAFLGLLSMAVGLLVLVWLCSITIKVVEGEVGRKGWHKEGFGGGRIE